MGWNWDKVGGRALLIEKNLVNKWYEENGPGIITRSVYNSGRTEEMLEFQAS